MSKIRQNLKLGLMVTLSVLGSALPFILVAPVIRVAFKNHTKTAFWMAFILGITFLVLVGLVPMAISLLSITLTVGLFSHLFDKNRRLFLSSFIAVFVGSLSTIFITQQWLVYKGTTLSIRLQEQVQIILKQAQKMNSVVKIDPDHLVSQAPSVLISLLILSLAVALIFESSVTKLLKFTPKDDDRLNLLNFKIPDSSIWIAMISFLFSFISLGNKSLSIFATNIVNIMIVLYFLQGLAVVETFFITLRLGFFIRFMTYVVFLIQLFFLVAAIGLIDFWIEFRKKFIRIRLNP